jgi:hypothetical protein
VPACNLGIAGSPNDVYTVSASYVDAMVFTGHFDKNVMVVVEKMVR